MELWILSVGLLRPPWIQKIYWKHSLTFYLKQETLSVLPLATIVHLLLIEVPSQLIICRPGLTFYLGPRDRFNLGEKYNSGIYLIGENKTKFNFNWVVKFQIDSRDIDSAFSKHIHVLAVFSKILTFVSHYN